MHLHHSKLSIQNDIENLSEAEVCVSKVAEIIGFNEHDNKQIQLALEEALTNIIKYSFTQAQSEYIDIEFHQEVLGLKVSIWVKGIPFDPERFPIYSRKKLEEEYDDSGLGNFLIRQVMDELSYNNHGHKGIEIVLKKYLPSLSIEELILNEETEEISDHKSSTEKPEYTIGIMEAEEAIEVSKLAYFSYGYTYPYENIYYPDKVKRLNASGHLTSMVARLNDGEIIGHSGLEMDKVPPVNAELGIAFSNPAYRGLGILNKLWDALITHANKSEALGVYAMAVTTHPYSQKAGHRFGLKDCLLYLSKVPVLKFKNIKDEPPGRESILVAYKYLASTEKIRVYPPENHAIMISKILDELGQDFDIGERLADQNNVKGISSELKIETNAEFITANIRFDKYGEDAVQSLEKVLRKLCIERYETIYLYLPLTDMNTAIYSPDFEKLNFFFSGLMPKDHDNVYLVLQYLNNQRIDYHSMDIDSAFGKELTDYIKDCDPNI